MEKTYRFATKKLVRHKTPALLKAQGVTLNEYALDDTEFVTQLKNKLLEEAAEVAEATEKAEITDELADVFEVLYTLAHVYNIPLDEVEKARLEKREKSGDFEHKLFSEHMDIQESSSRLQHFRDRPHKYPEIKQVKKQ